MLATNCRVRLPSAERVAVTYTISVGDAQCQQHKQPISIAKFDGFILADRIKHELAYRVSVCVADGDPNVLPLTNAVAFSWCFIVNNAFKLAIIDNKLFDITKSYNKRLCFSDPDSNSLTYNNIIGGGITIAIHNRITFSNSNPNPNNESQLVDDRDPESDEYADRKPYL